MFRYRKFYSFAIDMYYLECRHIYKYRYDSYHSRCFHYKPYQIFVKPYYKYVGSYSLKHNSNIHGITYLSIVLAIYILWIYGKILEIIFKSVGFPLRYVRTKRLFLRRESQSENHRKLKCFYILK